MKRVPFTKKARAKFPMEDARDQVVKKAREMKRTLFTKKRNIKFPQEDPNTEAKLALIRKAAKLRGEIFKNLPCVSCLPNNDKNPNTVPHHILNKGNYDHLRFVLTNLLPLCYFHHSQAHDEEQNFRNFLQDNYLRHYRIYLNERDNRKPVKKTVESLTKIVADLQYYADHPLEAEQVIYEKD